MGAAARSALLALFLFAASVAIALTSPLGGDYPGPPCSGCDYAGPPIDALVHGDLGRFFAEQPFMGSFSLVVRAPFAALSHLGRHTVLGEYRLGVIPCLLVLAALAFVLLRLMRRAADSRVRCAVVLALCLFGPMTFRAISWGHPEELLGGALCVGAVIAAAQARSLLAGVMLGAAVATKQWGLLAVAPTMLALPRERLRSLGVAAGIAALLTLPMLIGDPGRFYSQNHAAGIAFGGVTPTNFWWAFHHQTGIAIGSSGAAPSFAIPSWLAHLAHPLVLLLAALASFAYWRTRGRRDPLDALELLAFLFLLRCVLDPLTISYHHAPLIIALLAFEALRHRGLPVLSIYAALGLWSMSKFVAPAENANLLFQAYLAWSLPLVAWLAVSVLSPDRAGAVVAALGRRRALAAS